MWTLKCSHVVRDPTGVVLDVGQHLLILLALQFARALAQALHASRHGDGVAACTPVQAREVKSIVRVCVCICVSECICE